MKLDHVALWTGNPEVMKDYCQKHFGGIFNARYENPITGFKSYFLSFEGGSRLEIMYREDIPGNLNDTKEKQHLGLIHMAFSVKTMQEVDEKAKELLFEGFLILRGPRTTGDGYYEFETLDPDGNRIEVIYKA